AALALLWWGVAGGTASSWIVGVPTIVAAALLTPLAPRGPWGLSLSGALRFAAFFLRESLRGGVDVARRVSASHPRVAPGLVQYLWRLPEDGPARSLFALCVSLLPGTLVANVGGRDLLIHALDTGAPVAAELAALEDAVAGLFSLALPAVAPGAPGQG
ncbi:Na+/H+ antiporter subunit E, partial [Hydrogenophaga sp.]|uniref:Na+/H+ antiporter subunit E n=1 Tax=Hydrogenophaga sp. TaxID=1904254 RepID=UPI00286E7107